MIFRKWMPYLNFYLAIPFIEISTRILYTRVEMRAFDYLAWHIKVWKWAWEVNFYDTAKRRYS